MFRSRVTTLFVLMSVCLSAKATEIKDEQELKDSVEFERAGLRLMKKETLPEAVENFRKSISCNKSNISAYHNMGLAQRSLGDTRGACASFNNCGVLKLNRGQYSEAIEEFELALELDPKYIQANYNIKIARDKLTSKVHSENSAQKNSRLISRRNMIDHQYGVQNSSCTARPMSPTTHLTRPNW